MIWRVHKKIASKRRELSKKTNYRQLAFVLRERRPGFKVRVIPLVISALGGGIKETIKELELELELDLHKRFVQIGCCGVIRKRQLNQKYECF